MNNNHYIKFCQKQCSLYCCIKKISSYNLHLHTNAPLIANLLAAAMKALWSLYVIRGSGRLRKYCLMADVMVFTSHSAGSSSINFSDFRRSRPNARSFDTLLETPTKRYKPWSSSPVQKMWHEIKILNNDRKSKYRYIVK